MAYRAGFGPISVDTDGGKYPDVAPGGLVIEPSGNS